MASFPLTPEDEIRDLVETYGMSREEAATRIRDRDERRFLLATSREASVLIPEIREMLGLSATIEKVVRTVSTPAHYRIETDAGRVTLGPATRWATRPGEFAAAFLDIGEMPEMPKPGPVRNKLCSLIARAATLEDIGDEATEDGLTTAILSSYLALRRPVDSQADAEGTDYPWVENGQVVILGRAIDTYVRLYFQMKPTPAELGRWLRSAGCEPMRPSPKFKRVDGTWTTRSAWILPASLGSDEPAEQVRS